MRSTEALQNASPGHAQQLQANQAYVPWLIPLPVDDAQGDAGKAADDDENMRGETKGCDKNIGKKPEASSSMPREKLDGFSTLDMGDEPLPPCEDEGEDTDCTSVSSSVSGYSEISSDTRGDSAQPSA